MTPPTDDILLGFLEETLSPEQMHDIEMLIRTDVEIQKRLELLLAQTENGEHSLGTIWRNNKISCPERKELGKFLLGAISPPEKTWIEHHLNSLKCSFCIANLEDLKQHQKALTSNIQPENTRASRLFESSIGMIDPDT